MPKDVYIRNILLSFSFFSFSLFLFFSPHLLFTGNYKYARTLAT